MDLAYIEKHWINKMNTDLSASIAAWDSVADEYVYDDTVNFSSNTFLQLIQEKVPLNKDMSVLDIGCGAGAYSVALSEKVGKVVGTDFSPKMLDVGRRYVAKHKIPNIEFLERDWWSCDGREFEGKYDLVFAHTTPAIADYKSFIRMVKASKCYCALCKPARRTDEVSDAIRNMVGIKGYGSDDSIAYAFDTIWAMGSNPEIAYHKTVWKSSKPLDEAKNWYLNRLKGSCVVDEKTEQMIFRYLEEISDNGVVRETTHTTLVTMIWEVSK